MNFSKILFALIATTLIFTQCKKDDGDTDNNRQVEIQITDAPTDDQDVEGVFVTVVDVKVDGESFSGFSGKQTIDLTAYQNGNVKALGMGELEAKSYSNVTLVLDQQADENGSSPGCYVLMTDGNKKALSSSSSLEIVSNANINLADEASDETAEIILDFNIRKAVKRDDSNNEDYAFVSQTNLDASVRTVEARSSGNITGECDYDTASNAKVVAYAYKSGTYSDSEKQASSETNLRFQNAVTSATVDANGNYQLSYLEEGEYEVYFASYESQSSGEVSFKGMCQVGSLLSGIIKSSTTVTANAAVTLNVEVTAIL